MSVRMTVLGSGSGGNATLLEDGECGLLVDAGLGPRQIAKRLEACGTSWDAVQAVLLTHTHSDHWKDRTLVQLLRRGIPLCCHRAHFRALRAGGAAFADMEAAGLVRTYTADEPFHPVSGVSCRAFPLSHDGGATFGFRLEGAADLFRQPWAVGYASDLGVWDGSVASYLRDVDLLALEFNHDVVLQRHSGRPESLVARVMGDEGHLSNEQAADLVREILRGSSAGRLRHLVQLHLSRECNHPSLAAGAARRALSGLTDAVQVHTAYQDRPVCVPEVVPRAVVPHAEV